MQKKIVLQLIVICGAVAAGLLTKVPPPFVTVTIIGTSPAPAKEAGSLNWITSQPGISRFGLTSTIESPVISVVPVAVTIEIFTSAAATFLMPVRLTSSTVATVLPLPSDDVTLNGSGVRDIGLVTLTTAARPPASLVVVKISGCAATISSEPLN